MAAGAPSNGTPCSKGLNNGDACFTAVLQNKHQHTFADVVEAYSDLCMAGLQLGSAHAPVVVGVCGPAAQPWRYRLYLWLGELAVS